MFGPVPAADLTGMWQPKPFTFVLAAGAICSAAGLLLSQGPGNAAEVESPVPHTSATPIESAPAEREPVPFVTQVTPVSDDLVTETEAGEPFVAATPTATPEPIETEVAQEVATPTPTVQDQAESFAPAPSATVESLPAPHHAVVVENLPAKANSLLESMNAARVAEGLAPLAADSTLSAVALSRAQDLVENGYFAHYGPDGGSAFSELAARGVHYALAGENLARNNYVESQTVAAAFEGLMASPGHRANILEPKFTKVGVVAVLDGRMWVYVTVFMS